MKKYIFLLISLMSVLMLSAVTVENASLYDFLFGQTDDCAYDNWLSHVAEGIADPGYNVYAAFDRQTDGFGSYNTFDGTESGNWQTIVDFCVNGELTRADSAIAEYGFPYEVVEFNDTDSGRQFFMLREIPDTTFYDDNGTPADSTDDESGAFTYGWGLYIYSPNAANPVIITTPHINDDYPTTVMSYKAFIEWDAAYWCVSGTGREVLWTHQGDYSNSKTLCDPSRVADHPFNVAYQAFCDDIRDDFGRKELSVQIHTYDTESHIGYAPCQISAGNGKSNPNLPIRDLSFEKIDVVNRTPYIAVPANTVGIHDDVTYFDYYAFNWGTYDFTYQYGDTLLPVNGHMDLPGYTYNKQMEYTNAGMNDYDVWEPFFHVEFDELPNCYPQDTLNKKWFWGWNPDTGKYDMDKVWDNCIAFYQPFITAMGEVITEMTAMDNGQPPVAPSDLEVYDESQGFVTLQWTQASDFDFSTYEVLVADEPIGTDNYFTYDKSLSPALGSQATTMYTINGLGDGPYYFRVRAVDLNDNVSELSDEVIATPGLFYNNIFSATPRDGLVELFWTVASQRDNQGFMVKRATDVEGPYQTIADWNSNPELGPSISNYVNYYYNDYSVQNGTTYYYKIATMGNDNNEYVSNFVRTVTPEVIYKIMISNGDGSVVDSVEFGYNYAASDYFNNGIDATDNQIATGTYIKAQFYERYWQSNKELSRHIKSYYDIDTSLKTWVMRVKTSINNEDLTVSCPNVGFRDGRKLWVIDNSSGIQTDLAVDNYAFQAADNDYRTFVVYLGNALPEVDFAYTNHRYFEEGDELTFSWSIDYSFLIDHFDVFLRSETDEIMLAQDQIYYVSSVNWTVPENLFMEEANLVIGATLTNGEYVEYLSGWQVGTVPQQYQFSYLPGRKILSNPVTDINDINTVFGSNLTLHSYVDSAYQTQASFDSGMAYWADISNGNVTIQDATFELNPVYHDLDYGWNLVPNPHISDYTMDDLRFNYNGTIYRYTEAVQYKLIMNVCYTYDNEYLMADVINEGSGFWIYSLKNNVEVVFVPFIDNPDQMFTNEIDYTAKISVTQNNMDKDGIIIGTSEYCSDDFEEHFDLIEPPVKPFSRNISMYIHKDESFADYNVLNQDIRGLLSDEEDARIEWTFNLDIDDLNDIEFSLDTENFPDDVYIYLEYRDELYNLARSNPVIQPINVNSTGKIIVTREFVGNEVPDFAPTTYLNQNYPNPFNPETKIEFSIARDQNVELAVYNIKGQKVKDLVKDRLTSGPHTIIWEGVDSRDKKVGSGVYFYKLKTENKQLTRKMILLK